MASEYVTICTCGSWPKETHGPSNVAHDPLCALMIPEEDETFTSSDLLEHLSHNGIPWSSVDVETLEDGSLEIYAPDPLIWYVLSALGHHDGITGRLRTTATPDGLPVIVVTTN